MALFEGGPRSTHISSMAGGFRVPREKQVLSNVRFSIFTDATAGSCRATTDVRTYRPLIRSGSQRVAFWLMSDMMAGGVAPFLDLPTTGGDVRSGRGHSEGRCRGEHLVYGEAEYRGALMPSGLLGFVAFVNTSTIGWGWGKDGSRGFDLGIQEAF